MSLALGSHMLKQSVIDELGSRGSSTTGILICFFALLECQTCDWNFLRVALESVLGQDCQVWQRFL